MWEWWSTIWQQLYDLIADFFGSIIGIGDGIWYLITKLVGLAGTLLRVVVGVFNVLISVGWGIVNTARQFAGVTPSTSAYSRGPFAEGWSQVQGVFPGFDTLGWVCAGILWIALGVIAVRVVGKGRA